MQTPADIPAPNGRAARRGGRAARVAGDRRGNVALIFALVLTPIALLVFGSIDFYRANGIRGNLQDALDAAALAAARAPTTDPAEIDRIGRAALMAALANHSNMQPPAASFRLLNGRVVGQASAEVTPWVAQLFLPDGMTVSADSEVVRGATRLEIAMVLDVTGSMLETSGGVSKLQRLRTAGVDMVELLQDSAETSGDPDSVRISVVPFGQTVRLRAGDYRSGTNVAGWLVNSTTHATSNQLFRYRNATNNTVNQAVNRFQLFDRLGIAWGDASRVVRHRSMSRIPGIRPANPTAISFPISRLTSPTRRTGRQLGIRTNTTATRGANSLHTTIIWTTRPRPAGRRAVIGSVRTGSRSRRRTPKNTPTPTSTTIADRVARTAAASCRHCCR